MNIERAFPCVADMKQAARRRVPKFAFDYLSGGIGRGLGLDTNRRTLDAVQFLPRYLSSEADNPDCSQSILDIQYDAPFGVAPVGLGGLIWPRAAEYLALAAREYNLPFTLSGFATTSLEHIAELSEGHSWYQHYVTVDKHINESTLERASHAGYNVLVITVDVPAPTRRDHDIRNGLSVPPRFDASTVWRIMARPEWALAMARAGLPQFENLTPYYPGKMNLDDVGKFLTEILDAHVSIEHLKWFRDRWPGKLVVKGVLHPDDAVKCQSIGVDALVVSNHGGRQLDKVPSPLEVLPAIRQAVGAEYPLLADGGARNGLDIASFLAHGADFVLLGRAFMYAVAALGQPGAAHVINVLTQELKISMGQIGAPTINRLPEFLMPR